MTSPAFLRRLSFRCAVLAATERWEKILADDIDDPQARTHLALLRPSRSDAEIDPSQLAQEVRNAEEDVADAKDGATRDAAEHRLHQLKEVQASLTGG